jgi:hypothetical protein
MSHATGEPARRHLSKSDQREKPGMDFQDLSFFQD